MDQRSRPVLRSWFGERRLFQYVHIESISLLLKDPIAKQANTGEKSQIDRIPDRLENTRLLRLFSSVDGSRKYFFGFASIESARKKFCWPDGFAQNSEIRPRVKNSELGQRSLSAKIVFCRRKLGVFHGQSLRGIPVEVVDSLATKYWKREEFWMSTEKMNLFGPPP